MAELALGFGALPWTDRSGSELSAGGPHPFRPVLIRNGITILVNVHSSQEVCPFTRKFSRVAAEGGYAAREAWEAEWDVDPEEGEDDVLTEATIPPTDGPECHHGPIRFYRRRGSG